MLKVKVFLDKGGKLPEYQHVGDAGADVCSIDENFMLAPGEIKMVHTGIYMDVPEGYECQVRPRSGLALKNGITVINTPGTIDHGYKGECTVILVNHSSRPFTIEKGMRIGQFIFNKYDSAEFEVVTTHEEIGNSDRGTTGFGASGLK